MKTVVIGILGTTLDRRGKRKERWDKWRPTVSMCQQEDLLIDRLELLYDARSRSLAETVTEDIALISPETQVCHHHVDFTDAWDFEQVYAALLDFARSYTFKPQEENYLIHITTGTHVAQICLYLLNEAHYLPGKLLQTSPAGNKEKLSGSYQIIDLDLSKYDEIASRFKKEHEEGTTYLKGGITTYNATFNTMIDQLEQVSIRSNEPILIMGPTGAGKSQLAKRVYELRKHRARLSGELVTVNCATLRGENAMSTLFGHKKGAFTGAISDRPGLLKQADGGLLFLDEVGELGLDEQAMLLRAIEDKTFMPLGSDKEVCSHFQLIAGTNKNLVQCVKAGSFRDDLLARIDLWTYTLPSLKERKEDIEPNLDYELDAYAKKANTLVTFNKNARTRYLDFCLSRDALWSGNFRDLNASVTRMATLASGGRITEENVDAEIQRLKQKWQTQEQPDPVNSFNMLDQLMNDNYLVAFDNYELAALTYAVNVCRESASMAEAGRKLFNVSRESKSSNNDSHRIKQLLQKFNITFHDIKSL
ncbi:Nitric oxide reductase transcription regulator NorR2 [Thalassocella blandensis]|nr:Nitric oxide reductase transcription regulator NorR2 [Thalassocella blandensis]